MDNLEFDGKGNTVAWNSDNDLSVMMVWQTYDYDGSVWALIIPEVSNG